MKILTVDDVVQLIKLVRLESFIEAVIEALRSDFMRWADFHLSARHAVHFSQGVIELMPCADENLYAFKYVNGHPRNTSTGQLSVVAIGQLSDSDTGYPLMLSEMTLLTAIRTAAVGALAAQYLARENTHSMAIIGTGAQAEFQVAAFNHLFNLQSLFYFDIDPKAMQKFRHNVSFMPVSLHPCQSIIDAVSSTDIIVTATAAKMRQDLFCINDIQPGTHIHAMGGDCPSKTEFSVAFIKQCKVVVEYQPQSIEEGELQQCPDYPVYAELWELIAGKKTGRVNQQEITVFDSVGFALEDYSILRVVYQLSQQYGLGTETYLIPELANPKNLFGLLNGHDPT